MQNEKSPPLTTILLCGLCVLVTLANSTSLPTSGDLWSRIGHFADSTPEMVWNGHYITLFTTMFVHENVLQGIGITHVLFNIMWLYVLGAAIEDTAGQLFLFLFVAVSAVVGSCAELAVSGSIGIGASGVVYALFGLVWAGRGRYPEWNALANKNNILVMVGWGLFCIVATYFHMMSIANGAHAGGLLFGYAVGALFFAPRRQWAWIAPLAALLTICVLSVTYMPWSPDWTFWKADKCFDQGRYHQAIGWYRKSIARGGDSVDAWGNISSAWHNMGLIALNRKDVNSYNYDSEQEQIAFQKAGPSYVPPVAGGE